MDVFFEYLTQVSMNILQTFLSESSFLSLRPMLVAGLLAFIIIAVRLERRARRRGRTGTLNLKILRRALLPSWLFRHPSSHMDVRVFFINHALIFFGILSAIVTPFLFAETFTGLVNGSGLAETTQQSSWIERLCFTVFLVLGWDFASTYGHYLKHRIPFFWEFHKVHHSAEIMTPLTAERRHPMETLLSILLAGTVLGIIIAIWNLILGRGVQPVTIFGVLGGIYIWRLLGYNLRHSHIWISYGDFWNKILISPAHHQIHHSRDPRHHDTNFGHIFSIWDILLGTIYSPKENERVKFGIDTQDADDFKTLKGIYIMPFVKCWRMIAPKGKIKIGRKTDAEAVNH